ncbi:MAG: FAD-dependent oxidoreductase [Anaerolineaceae bacterium]|nr:FAD-dependent oxidoreductase [Anaerolineaceae bacterium]
MNETSTQILIVGGGLGGVAAALSALRMGRQVILVEETDWLGGQMTAQAVPPDEHPWIESTGCTATYRRLRNGIRDFYRQYYPLKAEVAANPRFNPGQGDVSFLCHEPRVSLAVIQAMLLPYQAGLQLQIYLKYRPVEVESQGDRIQAVTLENEQTHDRIIIHADYVLDATELGDLLPLANVEHICGAESQAQTGEPHALVGAPDPLDQQAISACFIVDFNPEADFTIEKPPEYEFWRNYQADFWPARQLSWSYADPISLEIITRPIFDGPTDRLVAADLWHYRRIFFRQNYSQGSFPSDMTVVNWPQTDYWLAPLVGVPPEDARMNCEHARQLSLSFLYWMQTEAPRAEGGYGYPGLRLRKDAVGTQDGLAKSIYIRESRRIQAEFTVCEQHVGVSARKGMQGAEPFADSVGIGAYRIDLHPSTAFRTYIDIPSWPFQIPLRALIPIRVKNLLPACKNLGVTHITNGCFREHPTEWNIGEAAGALAAFCLMHACTPHQVSHEPTFLDAYQQVLADDLDIQLAWPERIRLACPDQPISLP